jgi:Beta-lactamase enzyme family
MHRGVSNLCRLAAVPIMALAVASCSATPSGPPASSTSDPGTSGGSTTATPGGTAKPRPQPSPFARLSGYLSHRAGMVTAAVYDRHTGRTWIYHPGIRQNTASIVKVEILGAALREAEVAARALPVAERALVRGMIENSSNNAATVMLAKIGGPGALRKFDLLAGLTSTTPSTLKFIPGTPLPGWGLTKTTALDQVRLVKMFAYPNSLLSNRDRYYALNLMEHVESDQAWGISGGVPRGVTVALKNGWLPLANRGWQVNSVGWISGHGRDYVLAILSNRAPSYPYGVETVNAIAGQIYAALGR